jgi:hypothetical protein
LSNFIKRAFFAALFASVLLLTLPLTVRGAAAVTSFHMDRTNVQVGQTITITIHTTTDTTHVFAELGGTRTHAAQVSETPGVRTWAITLHPSVGHTKVDVFANTTNSTIGGAILSIPITVTGGGSVQPPGTSQGPLAIISITEIQPTAANQVRLEIVTGPEVNNVWINHSTNRWPQATQVSSDANTRTWRVELTNVIPWQQTVTVSANRSWNRTGATNREYTLTHNVSFQAQGNPQIIGNPVANPVQVVLGGSSTITVQTNNDVNYVWMMVDGARVNATRTNTAATSIRTWTAPVSPTTTGFITVYANSVNVTTGAFTRNVWVEALQTRVTIDYAIATWVPSGAAAADRTGVRIVVHTNLFATDLWVRAGNNPELKITARTRSGNTWIWDQTIAIANFGDTVPIHIRANDQGNVWEIPGEDVWATLSGVGGSITNLPGQGTQNQGLVLITRVVPTHISRNMHWPVELQITTSGDVTAIRVRDANFNYLVTNVTHFTEGPNDTREWTVPGLWPVVPEGAGSLSLVVEVRRGTTAWTATQATTVPVL